MNVAFDHKFFIGQEGRTEQEQEQELHNHLNGSNERLSSTGFESRGKGKRTKI